MNDISLAQLIAKLEELDAALAAWLATAGALPTNRPVAEMIGKLLTAANLAQEDKNLTLNTNKITTYGRPSLSTPTQATDGNWYSRKTYSVTTQAPLNASLEVAVNQSSSF